MSTSQIQQQQKQVQALKGSYLNGFTNPTISGFQAVYPKDAPARGPVWIARTSLNAPKEDQVRDLLYNSIDNLAQPGHIYPRKVPLAEVRLEWLGHRPVTDLKAPEPEMAESEKYRELQRGSQKHPTILYLHGGAFYIGSPVACRSVTAQLARLSKGRVAVISYRLAPQAPFPSAILDALVAYFSLLSPGPDAWHDPIPAKRVVIAGDSAGGNLGAAVIQVLLDLKRRDFHKLLFNGRQTPIDLPAGVTFLSPYIDYPLSLPSWMSKGDVDYLDDIQRCHDRTGFNTDDLWPTKPPRGDVYCDTSCFTHPLVNPALAPSWAGAPPMWLVSGEERLVDGIRFLAQSAATSGVPVIYSEYEGMPHDFAIMLSKLPQSKMCCQEWAEACLRFAKGGKIEGQAKLVHMPGNKSSSLSSEELTNLTLQDVETFSRRSALARTPWTGPETRSQL